MLKKFDQLIDGLIGKKCSHAERFYGSGLHIDFGAVTKSPSKVYKGTTNIESEWSLYTTLCGWFINEDTKTILSDKDGDKVIDQKLSILEGRTLTAIVLHPDLSYTIFKFSGDILLVLFRTDTPYEQWTLKNPDRMYLTMEPDRYTFEPGGKKPTTNKRITVPMGKGVGSHIPGTELNVVYFPEEHTYLEEHGYKPEPDEGEAKRIFLETIQDYLNGKVDYLMMDAVADHLYLSDFIYMEKKFIDKELGLLLKATSKLGYYKSVGKTKQVEGIDKQLSDYLEKNKS